MFHLFVYVCVCGGMYGGQGLICEIRSLLSPCGSEDQTPVVRLSGKDLYSQNHLIGPILDSFGFPPWNGITLCLFLVM